MKYIGAHSTDNLYDNYLGSGFYLKRAIKKYGRINFSREIIKICESRTDMYQKEHELVTEDIVTNKNYYNMTLGGRGGQGKKLSKSHRDKLSFSRRNRDIDYAQYLPRLYGDSNPMKRPELKEYFKKLCTGRKRKYLDNGKWCWAYPPDFK
jgi:hypothetical protein